MPYFEYLNTPEWHARRKAKVVEAEFRCVVCNSRDRLEVHHRTYQRRGNEDRSDLTVLCHLCHSLFHGKPAVDLAIAA
jgi:hypothetical protein